jgi:hypothetical protein
MLRILFTGAALALLALAAPAARATDPQCRGECLEARRICHRAAHVAHEACHHRCADAVQDAISRTRELCLRESLTPGQCALRIREATFAASLTCRTDCWQVRGRALARCGEEISECAVACNELDPTCVQGCRSEAAQCRTELGSCGRECADDLRERIAGCREEAQQQTCKLESYASCVQQARKSAARCADACHAELECGGELRECFQGCAPDPAR